MADEIRNLQGRAAAFLKRQSQLEEAVEPEALAEGAQPTRRWFSWFLPSDAERAFELTNRFVALANRHPGAEGLEAVLDEAERASNTDNLDLVKHALMVFITHHPEGSRLPIPALVEREPEKLRPSREALEEGAPGPEGQLDWYREDPWANAHHEHWHVVYPFRGVADGMNNGVLKDRQGELFFYMHQQMLARYDTERLAAGLAPVKPLSSYSGAIAEGYDPNISGYSSRPVNTPWSDINRPDFSYALAQHTRIRNRIRAAVQAGTLQTSGARVPIDPSLLGAVEEASIGSTSPGFYGSHHNLGHMLIAFAADPQGVTPPGVMADTATAIRDPIFYRWHRHVDDTSFTWQERQQPNDFSDAPNVLIRKSLDDTAAAGWDESPDIILCFKDDLPGADQPGFDGQAFGEQRFGGSYWNQDFSSGGITTDTLETMMREQQIDLDGETITVPYLDQKEFCYFVRIKNRNSAATDVTVRIFLVASTASEQRRMWIEMDKFRYTLAAGDATTSPGTVVFRPASLSSVIRKPATKPPVPISRTGTDPAEEYCECGWAYNLLVPRGTTEGMSFRLLVMLTDWQQDQITDDVHCGSMSFCGARDRYPDSRVMGYPFDRPFPAGSTIAATMAAQRNVASREIKIKLV